MEKQELFNVLLSDISFSFSNTKFSSSILQNLTRPLKDARTVGELKDKLIQVIQNYQDLDIYKSVHAKVIPGDKPISAHVQFDFKEVQPYNAQIGYNNSEGGALEFKGTLKNFFSRCETTEGTFEFRHNTRNYLIIGASHAWEDLCPQVTEQKQSVWGQIEIGQHKFSVIRSLYYNHISTLDSSEILLREAVPFCENYLVYDFLQSPSLRLKTKLSEFIFSFQSTFTHTRKLAERINWENILTTHFLLGSPRANQLIRTRYTLGFDSIAEN